MVKSFKSEKWPIIWNGLEQSHIFAYSQQFPENINWIDYKYNCIPKRQNKAEINDSYLNPLLGLKNLFILIT